MVESSKDCLECRLVSGFGLMGVGAYIFYQAKHRKKLESFTMKTLSAGAVTLGVARLFNSQFFKSSKEKP